MKGYLISETNDKGWRKPLKSFKKLEKALDYAEEKQKYSNDNNLELDYSYTTIEIEE